MLFLPQLWSKFLPLVCARARSLLDPHSSHRHCQFNNRSAPSDGTWSRKKRKDSQSTKPVETKTTKRRKGSNEKPRTFSGIPLPHPGFYNPGLQRLFQGSQFGRVDTRTFRETPVILPRAQRASVVTRRHKETHCGWSSASETQFDRVYVLRQTTELPITPPHGDEVFFPSRRVDERLVPFGLMPALAWTGLQGRAMPAAEGR